jgi:hypothetical protein
MSQETRPSPKDAANHATAKAPRVSALRPRTDLSRVLSSPAGIPVASPSALQALPVEEPPSTVTIGVTLDADVAQELMRSAEAVGMTLGQAVAELVNGWAHDSREASELAKTPEEG